MRSTASILSAPALCLAMLGGIALEKRTHIRPEDAAPYHARAKAAIDAWPSDIGDSWKSFNTEIPEAALRLLRPNTTLSRHYTSTKDGAWADLLIVQCLDPNDMSGHYPPNCYRNNGEPMVVEKAREWQVGGRTVRGMEYHFERNNPLGLPIRRCVYNFFVLPGRGIVADMAQVREATGDYQRRNFGAAQFQVVMSADMPTDQRDEIFTTLIGANPGVFDVLNPSGI